MIDIHSHIIWGVDDGPSTKQEAMELIRLAAKEGIEQIIATSHALHPNFHADITEVEQKLQELQQMSDEERLGITLYRGHEVRITEDLVEQIRTKQIAPLHTSTYVLVEFPSGTVPLFTREILRQLVQAGYRPVIAHPERNKVFASNTKKLRELIEAGAFAQVTAGSVSGDFGKEIQRISLKMIDEGLIHCYGSDVHDKKVRAFSFDKGLSYLESKNRQDMVEYFLENNERILQNKNLLIIERKVSFIKEKFAFLSKK
ncbi:CpsB/CapC family capsule biosynthesis tyrosine phosphatase [Chryseomicrobium sp. FSL W7-1435]|uniref:tyrosine-protein phosphatase n=1 Tax=Chryseomicrobium sp. FSL W7-1435 TaxID=2921704 RepID=UPI00315AAFD5